MHLLPFSTLAERIAVRREVRRAVAERERVWDGSTTPGEGVPERIEGSVVTARIHPFALLGHQVTSWMAGWLWARDLGLPFGGGNVTRDTSGLFEFGHLVAEVPRELRHVRLPAVLDERHAGSLERLRARVESEREPANFRLPVDPFRYRFDDLADTMRSAVMAGSGGARLRATEAGADYIALHIRRPAWDGEGVSRVGTPERWLEEEWYLEVVRALRSVDVVRELEVRAYSVGAASEFSALQAAGVVLRLDGDRDEDFVELAGARVLVMAPSSFSFVAGLVSRAHVIQPAPWWHGVPELGRWLPVTRDANPEPSVLTPVLDDWLLRR